MKIIDHNATSFSPSDLPQDAGVFFLNQTEASGPPRKITPYMKACIYCLENDVNLPEDSDFAFNHWERIKSLFPTIGFFMLVFGFPLILSPGRFNLHWAGWLLISLGSILLGGFFVKLVVHTMRIKAGYNYLLANGTLFDAVVQEHLVYDGIVREMKFHKPMLKDGVPVFDRQWVMQSRITMSINNNRIKFITFRPEITSVFNTGTVIPVLWHPRWPKLFIPVQTDIPTTSVINT